VSPVIQKLHQLTNRRVGLGITEEGNDTREELKSGKRKRGFLYLQS